MHWDGSFNDPFVPQEMGGLFKSAPFFELAVLCKSLKWVMPCYEELKKSAKYKVKESNKYDEEKDEMLA